MTATTTPTGPRELTLTTHLKKRHNRTIEYPAIVTNVQGRVPIVQLSDDRSNETFLGLAQQGQWLLGNTRACGIEDSYLTIKRCEPHPDWYAQQIKRLQIMGSSDGCESVEQRVLKTIDLIIPSGGILPVSRSMLAGWCGCSREMVGRVISDLHEKGVLKAEKSTHRIERIRDYEKAA